MDPIVLAAGTALVEAMVTDAWQKARTAIVSLWKSRHPDRVPAIDAELLSSREEALAARAANDSAAVEGLVADWRRKLHRLVTADPSLITELKRILDDELTPLLPEAEQVHVTRIVQNAKASFGSKNYQAARDLTINEK